MAEQFNTATLSAATSVGIVTIATGLANGTNAPTVAGSFITSCLTNTGGVLATNQHCMVPINGSAADTAASYFDLGVLIADLLQDGNATAELNIVGTVGAPTAAHTLNGITNSLNTNIIPAINSNTAAFQAFDTGIAASIHGMGVTSVVTPVIGTATGNLPFPTLIDIY